MTYAIANDCNAGRYTDRVSFRPVECFHESKTMLVIDPEGFIECGACAPECPPGAIAPGDAPDSAAGISVKARHAALWPAIDRQMAPPSNAVAMDGVTDKLGNLFSPRAAPRPAGRAAA